MIQYSIFSLLRVVGVVIQPVVVLDSTIPIATIIVTMIMMRHNIVVYNYNYEIHIQSKIASIHHSLHAVHDHVG